MKAAVNRAQDRRAAMVRWHLGRRQDSKTCSLAKVEVAFDVRFNSVSHSAQVL